MSSTLSKAYVVHGKKQMSLFSTQQLNTMLKPASQRQLYCIVRSPSGNFWKQEIERRKGETAWQAVMRYKREVLGPAFWITSYGYS